MKSNAILSLTLVFGLLIGSSSAAPISGQINRHIRLARREDNTAACPGTLRGPSGNAYFAFSTNLDNNIARQACASCYNGILADVGVADMQFLGSNVQQDSWIKSWNGDDYTSSCVTLKPSGGSTPSVNVDIACQSEFWPLCVATSDAVDGAARLESFDESSGLSLSTLAVPYSNVNTDIPALEAFNPTLEDQTVQDEMTKTTDITMSENGEGMTELKESETIPSPPEATSPRRDEVTPTIMDYDFNPADVGPPSPEVTSPRRPNGAGDYEGLDVEVIEVSGNLPESTPAEQMMHITEPAEEMSAPAPEPVAAAPEIMTAEVPATVIVEDTPVDVENNENAPEEAPAPVVVAESVPEPMAEVAPEPMAEVAPEPMAEVAPEPVAEVAPEPVAAQTFAPAEDMQVQEQSQIRNQSEQDLLSNEKEQIFAAFEDEMSECSSDLASAEQDPLVNEYAIEKAVHSASCSAKTTHRN
ncbi:hypothetical protein BGZ99_005737 [Dissophora globulifera]|uniref:Uncharacterized protein n=1 Tax=Dissophora globulifera TaxID=979702 RepID=A0A9P6RIX7_9FUNG|nr:hypothetical protein BGZ99_005737 [Dissophora globulifera]